MSDQSTALVAMLKTGKVPDALKANPQAGIIEATIVAPMVKLTAKKNKRLRELHDVTVLQKRLIDSQYGSVQKGKRYVHKFKGGSRTGVCVGFKPLIVFDDDDSRKVVPLSENQLAPAEDNLEELDDDDL